jgi:hypothetical protein
VIHTQQYYCILNSSTVMRNGKVIVTIPVSSIKRIVMKRIFYTAGFVMAMMSCNNNALDGNAKTDTTTMPVDTVATNNAGRDTATTVNTNTGSYSTTDTAGMRKPDVNAPTASDPKSRNTTPGYQKSADSVVHNKQ